jgi:hypothetical protein
MDFGKPLELCIKELIVFFKNLHMIKNEANSNFY